ncbi:MAG: Tfp structural protein [Candidatus Portnoybacteria bacterium CG10_big_fil_rev_8_21_14_0_10_36_7]|uniref:Tfp structural protein n=1 Tax=Candidatus Portnoybacteria bacterium CG10_big_fil_rev_8_21_14_0_10_36_7 TaxID=1974812 RepID=A0A2M8KEW1_9BACT|nr:MAG: Tfp structural protein [Candidatus Portnoybacteria bacterium CG10_big_fil_rev_8_21_14_0_10_36_7]
MNYKSKSFTLIELLVVTFIITLLASIVAVQVNKARIKARDTTRLRDLKTIETAT